MASEIELDEVTEALDDKDNFTRHSNVGIALHKVLFGALKDFIDTKLPGKADPSDINEALLILEKSSLVESKVQNSARKVRTDVRNAWASGNIDTWTSASYNTSFRLMQSLLSEINNSSSRLLAELEGVKRREVDDVIKICPIAKGRFGNVWTVKCNSLGQQLFALKIVRMYHLGKQEFMRETDALKRLDHPGIVKLYNSFITEMDGFKSLNIIMELCQTDLANVIGKGPLSRDGNTAFIRQMSVISEYLYQEKLIHRNITPSNILIKEKDTDDSMALYKLGGFGEVLPCQDMDSTSTKTIAGTFKYMAPEVIKSSCFNKKPSARYSAKADAWSFGIVVLECCLGEMMCEKVEEEAKIKEIQIPSVKQVVKQLLIKDPRRRKYLHEVSSTVKTLSMES